MVRLEIESAVWWALVIFVAGSRFMSRRIALGTFRSFQSDDYGMLVTLCFYTTLIVTINIVRHTNSNLLPPGFDVQSLTEADKSARAYGSKLILVVEQSQCATIWGAKICLLILYHRLTQLRWENWAIKTLAGYVVTSFVVMEVLYFGVWCQPFHQYWAVPTNNMQCDAATNHLITNATFNLSSDVIMIAIGLPMFLRMKLPWQKKLPLILVFSLGIFVVLAAVLNKVYSFSQPFGDMWSYWYVRESSTAVLVANLPFVWRFWRHITRYDSITITSSSSRRATLQRNTTDTIEHHRSAGPPNSQLSLSAFLAEHPSAPPRDEHAADADGRVLPHLASKESSSAGLTLMNAIAFTEPRTPRLSCFGLARPAPLPAPVLTQDSPIRSTIRRDSDCEKGPGDDHTTSSSPVSSLPSSWSAGSFV